jgi:putative DNA primase/helicase
MADIVLTSKKEIDREIAAGKLVGLRFGYCQEITGSGRTKLSTAVLKNLLSGDKQTARRFFKDESKIKPTWHLHALVNDLPSIDGSEGDHATERRIRVVPWQCEFAGASERPREEVDRILASEAKGILAWLVRGYMDYRKDGLRPAAVVERATKDYLNGGRPDRERVREFIDEECIVDPGAVCPTKDLYQRYREWFGEGACDIAVFGRKLTQEKFGGSKSHGIAKRFGLRLRPAGEDGEDKPPFSTLYARGNQLMVTG